MLKIKINKFLVASILYLLVGTALIFLLSIYFLPPGIALSGHDSGLPLDSKQFLNTRLFAWDERIGFGVDNSHLFGSLTLHLIDYISSLVAAVPYAGNWFNLFFWLEAIFISAFVFGLTLKGALGNYFVFIFPPFILVNFYLFQSIFILERAKYSILIGSLLFLALVLRLQERKISLPVASIVTAFIFFFFNGGSLLGISLYGSLFVVIFSLLLFYFLYSLGKKNFSDFFRLVSFLFLTTVSFLLLNSYQILPYLPSIINKSFFTHLGTESVQKSIDWVNYISQNTSLLNIFRLEGVPTWFSDLYTVSGEHPYSSKYVDNNFFVLMSFAFPVVAFLSLLLVKTKKAKLLVFLFALITLVAIPFAAGTHPPFGGIYTLLYNNFPGFFIFRTPYYKFATAFFIGMGVLMAATSSIATSRLVNLIGEKAPNQKLLKDMVGLLVCTVIIGSWFAYYHFLFIPENVFSWKVGSSTRAEIPSYVNEARIWLNQINGQGRILLIPPIGDQTADSYDWGYWSLSPLSYSLTSASFVSNELNLKGEEAGWVNLLYKLLREGKRKEFIDIATRLGIKFILLREDATPSKDEVDYQKIFQSADVIEQNEIVQLKSFGRWILYEINRKDIAKIKVASSVVQIPEGEPYLSREFIVKQEFTIVPPKDLQLAQYDNLFNKKIQAQSCLSCLLEKKGTFSRIPPVAITSNSLLYFLKLNEEKERLKNAQTPAEKNNAYLSFSLRRASEVMVMLALDQRDRDILNGLQVINSYFDEVYNISLSSIDPTTDFVSLRLALDYLDPIQGEYSRYVGTRDFDQKSANLREEIFALLWRIEKIKKFYGPLFSNIEEWSTHKIYKVNFPENKNYVLNFNLESMPQDKDGKTILPFPVEFIKNGEKKELKLEESLERWAKINLGYQEQGEAKLELRFKDLPNLFQLKHSSTPQFPDRKRACLTGSVQNFKSHNQYFVKVLSKDKGEFKLFIRDPDKIYSQRHQFIRGEVEVDIPFNYRYLYHPSSIKNLEILICSRDEVPLNIQEISVQQVYSPIILSAVENQILPTPPPKIDYKVIDPTEYSVHISGSSGPFLLVFNERASPFWKLTKKERDKEIDQKNHVLVDGYANGWIIDEKGDFALNLKYTPQKLFLIGTGVTGVSVIILLGFLLLNLLKRKI